MCLMGWVVPTGRREVATGCVLPSALAVLNLSPLQSVLVSSGQELATPSRQLPQYEPAGRGVPPARSSSMSLCCCFRPACLSLETAPSGKVRQLGFTVL